MRRLHLSIAWGVVVASSLWIAGQIGWARDSVLTFFFAFLIPACLTAGFVLLWRRGEGDIRSAGRFLPTGGSQYRTSTLHSRRRAR